VTLRLSAPVRPVAALALLCALLAPGGVEGAPSASSRIMQVPGFGAVTVYAPPGQPAQVVLFLSGDGGWNLGVVPMAERLRQEGALVIGVDVRALMKGLEAAKSCGYPAGPLEELSRTVQARLTLPKYLPPLVVGYSSGATLAYAAIAGAPPETFTGALSLGFCPDLELHRPLCQIRGVRATKRSKGVGYDLAPFAAMTVPWTVLHGAQDQVCALEPTRRFVAATGRATLVELPKVGHGFGVPARWEPAYVNAYRAIARIPSALATERVRAPDVADLALVEVPATGTRITDTFAVVLSGDGGWAELDKAIAAALAARGIPVVGWSSLDYYWSPRTPERAAADLGRVVQHYTEAWQRPRVIVVGYSFGADVAPFLVNRLPDALTPQVTLLALLAPSDHASFEFHVTEWLRAGTGPEHPTRPERDRLRVPTVCISPLDEPPSACATPNPLVRREATGAGHHFSGEYTHLVDLMVR
jgi:type IV secretory pathway VirJ component